VLWRGLQQRHIGATHMNERSSRSHAVFTLSVEVAQTCAGVTSTRVARLSLVDLAGSERQQGVFDAVSGIATPYQSLRVKEAASINKSLSALTNVIMSLSREERSRRRSSASASDSGDRRRQFVHYRDSKLTFLLRDSLGGNSKTVIVANMSASALCLGETLSTLKFAARAKHIRCAAVRNEEFSGTVESLTQEVKGLRLQLASLSGRSYAASRSRLSLAESSVAPAPLGRQSGGEDAAAPEEHEALYSRKRVRRLEVLLAAALERERHADQRRHHLQRLAEFLEGLDFRKTQYMRKLHDVFSSQFSQLGAATMSESEEVVGMTAKLDSFGHLLGSLVGVAAAATPAVEHPKKPTSGGTAAVSAGASDAAPGGARPCGAGGAAVGGSPPQARQARKRGTSQSLQRGSPERVPVAGRGAADDAAAGSPSRMRLDAEPHSGAGSGLVDEASFLREENRRILQQLEYHPEVERLAAENRSLRLRMAALDAGAHFTGHPGERKSHAAPRTQRPDIFGNFDQSQRPDCAAAADRSSSNSSDDEDMARKDRRLLHEEQLLGTKASQESSTASSLPMVTSQMILRSTDTDDESTLRTWIYFQKMAKEVEELLRARENLEAAVVQARDLAPRGGGGASVSANTTHVGGRKGTLASEADGGGGSRVSSLLLGSTVDPQAVDDLVQTTQDALQLAQTIIDSRMTNQGTLEFESTTEADNEGGAAQAGEDRGANAGCTATSAGASGNPQMALQRVQRYASSTPQLSPSTHHGNRVGGAGAVGLAGFLARNKAFRGLGLGPVSEQDPAARDASSVSPKALSATERSVSPRREGGSERAQLRQALQRVKQLHGTLDMVNSAYNDAHDQFQCLREEYESRIAECQFFELQCSRLDIHCHELTERLHGAGHSVRAGIGSFSATGFSPTLGRTAQQRRSFSLSSLRDVNFWEQRFQELSQLTGIEEGESLRVASGRMGDTIWRAGAGLSGPQHCMQFGFNPPWRQLVGNGKGGAGACGAATSLVAEAAAPTKHLQPGGMAPVRWPDSHSTSQSVLPGTSNLPSAGAWPVGQGAVRFLPADPGFAGQAMPHSVSSTSLRSPVLTGQAMPHSVSLSSLHSEGAVAQHGAPGAASTAPWPALRRVASAPIVPTCAELCGGPQKFRTPQSSHSLTTILSVPYPAAGGAAPLQYLRQCTGQAGTQSPPPAPTAHSNGATSGPGEMSLHGCSGGGGVAIAAAAAAAAAAGSPAVTAAGPAQQHAQIVRQLAGLAGCRATNTPTSEIGRGGTVASKTQQAPHHELGGARHQDVSRNRMATQPFPSSCAGRVQGPRGDCIGDGIGDANMGGSAGCPGGGIGGSSSSGSVSAREVVRPGGAPLVTAPAAAVQRSPMGTSAISNGGARPVTARSTPQQRPQSRDMWRTRAVTTTPSTGAPAHGAITFQPSALPQQRHGA